MQDKKVPGLYSLELTNGACCIVRPTVVITLFRVIIIGKQTNTHAPDFCIHQHGYFFSACLQSPSILQYLLRGNAGTFHCEHLAPHRPLHTLVRKIVVLNDMCTTADTHNLTKIESEILFYLACARFDGSSSSRASISLRPARARGTGLYSCSRVGSGQHSRRTCGDLVNP